MSRVSALSIDESGNVSGSSAGALPRGPGLEHDVRAHRADEGAERTRVTQAAGRSQRTQHTQKRFLSDVVEMRAEAPAADLEEDQLAEVAAKMPFRLRFTIS